MKIIDLLNMISKGEEVPKKIKFYDKYYTWYDNEYTRNKGYCLEPLKSDSNSFLEINTVYDLNNEVEILEEEKKIPEKIKIDDENRIQARSTGHFVYKINQPTKNIILKLNEIIDYLKSKGE